MPDFLQRYCKLFAATLLGFVAVTCVAAPAQRIVSINLCTDQLLLLLAPAQRIQSVSFLAQNPAYSAYVDKVGDIPLNHARIEEIVSYDPDLILAYELSDRRLVSLLQKLGYRVAVVPSAQSLDDVGEIIVEVAALLDERDRGKQLRAAMLRDLQRLSAQDFQQRPLAVIYAPNGYSPGTHTLQGSILDAAGFENISARLGNAQGAAIPLEQILRHQPDLFIIDDEESNAHSLAQKKLTHPALAKSIDRSAMAHINGRFWSCPTPMVVEAVGRLRGYH